jgi:hypothetical protein
MLRGLGALGMGHRGEAGIASVGMKAVRTTSRKQNSAASDGRMMTMVNFRN